MCGRSTSRPTRMTRRQSFGISVWKNEISRRGLGYRGGGRVKKKRDSLPFLSFLLHETRTRRVPPSSPRNGGQSISSRYALSSFSYRVVPPAHPSSPSGIGESSSIKGPISDDKDLEMNGPRHSNGSLSSCPTARFSAIPPLPLRKQSCFELLITV